MIEREKAYALIEAEEGFRERPYRDTKGLWSWGIGECLERNPPTAAQWKLLLDRNLVDIRIKHEGASLLMKDIVDARLLILERLVPVFVKLNDVRQAVLLSMSFQLGINFIYSFKDFMKAVAVQDWPAAAIAGLDSEWAREDTPERARRMMNWLERGEWT
jgi:lysozyme